MQTPREVYDELKKEGYRVQYYRLPLTDGEAPKETIFDVFYSHVKDVPPSDALIFNCQMGGGRTTTGMVIGCLIRMHTSGVLQHCNIIAYLNGLQLSSTVYKAYCLQLREA